MHWSTLLQKGVSVRLAMILCQNDFDVIAKGRDVTDEEEMELLRGDKNKIIGALQA